MLKTSRKESARAPTNLPKSQKEFEESVVQNKLGVMLEGAIRRGSLMAGCAVSREQRLSSRALASALGTRPCVPDEGNGACLLA